MSQQDSIMPARGAGRRFGPEHPSQEGVIQVSVRHPNYAHQPFRPLPTPTGAPPYHLSLDDILAPEQMQVIRNAGKLVFHIDGDTGAVKGPQSQQIVAYHMEQQLYAPDPANVPAFFYHLGDVVYYYGQSSEYYAQFYDPYAHYSAPIFA